MKTKTKKKGPAKGATRSRKGTTEKAKTGKEGKENQWILRLYVAGETARSLAVFANLRKICDEYLANRHSIEVIDLSKQPELAQNDQIVALPTLVRKLPVPVRRVIGDLSNLDKVLVGMDLTK